MITNPLIEQGIQQGRQQELQELVVRILSNYFPFIPFISNKQKFLEFFPKIAKLEIPEPWKFYCDLFAQKTNPHYEEVRKMIFQLAPDDMIKAIESVPLENVPEAFNKMLSRFPEEKRIETLNRLKVLISEDKLKEWAREILDGDRQKSAE